MKHMISQLERQIIYLNNEIDEIGRMYARRDIHTLQALELVKEVENKVEGVKICINALRNIYSVNY